MADCSGPCPRAWRPHPSAINDPCSMLACRLRLVYADTTVGQRGIVGDYVRTARAQGLRERGVVLKHALRNALLQVITSTG